MSEYAGTKLQIGRMCTLNDHFVLEFDTLWITGRSRRVTEHVNIIWLCIVNGE